jgi:hypothetical protein
METAGKSAAAAKYKFIADQNKSTRVVNSGDNVLASPNKQYKDFLSIW